MSTAQSGPPPAPAPAPVSAPGFDAAAEGRRTGLTPSGLFSTLTLVPALAATAWLAAVFPFVARNDFSPLPVFTAALLAAAVVVPLGLRLARHPAAQIEAGWWSLGGTIAVAGAFGVFTAVFHDTNVVIRRDPASYAQIGYWLAHHHTLQQQIPAADFGAMFSQLVPQSPGYYPYQGHLVPQFMSGWPTVLAAGDWLGGWRGELVMPALAGACGILVLAGLVGRLVGAKWAPLTALAAALCFPIQHVSTSTYSESLSLVLVTGAVRILTDAVWATGPRIGAAAPGMQSRAAVRAVRWSTVAGGLMLGCTELARLDGGVAVALLLPVAGFLWATRRPGALPFLGGLLVGGTLGAVDCAYVTEPYVAGTWSSVRLMLWLLAASALATLAAAVLVRRLAARPGRAPRIARWAPAAAAGSIVVAFAVLALRPYFMTQRDASFGWGGYIAGAQQLLGLSADPDRTYAEQSVRWLSWYVGWPMVVLAAAAAAYFTWRTLRDFGRDAKWLPALLFYVIDTVLVLYRPADTPDHPWVDRRFADAAYPGLILFAVAALPLIAAALRRGRFVPALGQRWNTVLVGALAAALVVPALHTDLPVSGRRTEIGEIPAVATICRALGPDDSVVLVGPDVQIWIATLRDQCGVPVAQLFTTSAEVTPAQKAEIGHIMASIRAVGRIPVIAARDKQPLTAYGMKQPLDVETLAARTDQEALLGSPDGTLPLFLQFWAARR